MILTSSIVSPYSVLLDACYITEVQKMFEEVRSSNTGLIIRPTSNTFLKVFNKKVTNQIFNLCVRNARMLDLVRKVGDQPIASYKDHPVVIINKPFVPPAWRQVTIQLEAAYYQKAIASLHSNYTITINLSANLIRKASGNGDYEYIRRAIDRELRRKLNRKVDYWFIFETATRTGVDKTLFDKCCKRKANAKCKKEYPPSRHEGRIHVHGVIAIDDFEKDLVKNAVRTLNGKENSYFVRDELYMTPVTNGIRWADYATKHTGLTRYFTPSTNIISCTNKVTKLAKELYENDRMSVKNVMKISRKVSP